MAALPKLKSVVRKNCSLCPDLLKPKRKIVWGELYCTVPTDRPQGMVIAEAPGEVENYQGRPLVGSSGQEARHYLSINGIAGRGVILDNICKCRPPDNRDPNAGEIANCTKTHLIPWILFQQPKWIIAMGRVSIRFFLGNVDVELVHGIGHTIDFHGLELVIIPTYHPAAGLHSPEQMILFQADMKVAGGVVRGDIEAYPVEDEFEGREDYQLVTSISVAQ